MLLRNKKYAKNGTREFAQLDAAEINTFTVFTHHHDITEILLKVVLNTINPNCIIYISDDCKYMSFPSARQRHQIEPYDHMKDAAFFYDVTERFKKGMQLDPEVKRKNVEVNTISKVTRLYNR